jgi:hypothetical protein
MLVGLTPFGASTGADDLKPAPQAEVTLKGNVLCNRATDMQPWFGDPKDGDHTPVIYAVEGTPTIAEQVRKMIETYPDRGLNVEEALAVQEQFSKHLKYFLSRGSIAEQIHKDVEAGSRMLAVSGRISENGGKTWITITRFEPGL